MWLQKRCLVEIRVYCEGVVCPRANLLCWVFAGTLDRRDGQEAELTNARRIWYWSGAASLSELAQRGPSKPNECKFPAAVDRVLLTQVIEILSITSDARKLIEGVPIWTQ